MVAELCCTLLIINMLSVRTDVRASANLWFAYTPFN